MGTIRTTKPVSPQEHIRIIGDRMKGMTIRELAKKYERSTVTVHKIVRDDRVRTVNGHTDKLGIVRDYKDELKNRSITTLEQALDSTSEAFELYKAAPIAVQVMKGLGEFQEQSNQGVTIMLGSLPAGWSARYQGIAERVDDTSSGTISSGSPQNDDPNCNE